MRVFSCTDHAGHYVGVASVIVAANETDALALLDAELLKHGLKLDPRAACTLQEVPLDRPAAHVLQDGDY